MYPKTRHSIALLLLLLVYAAGSAQTGFYVPQKGKVYFAGDTATIFSNVLNKGQVGIGKNAVVNFRAARWENDAQAQITDESNGGNGTTGTGGTLRFIKTDTSLPQLLIGGYNAASRSGASFPNITIANPFGVKLVDASTKIRRRLHFEDGHLYALDNIIVVGDGQPGTITGYDDSRFIVTGQSVSGGFLLREKISRADSWVAFPVGTADGKYTPAALRLNSGSPDDFYARVFDSVKTKGVSGQDMSAISVNKTWQMGKLFYPGQGNVDVSLQHLVADEGSLFNARRQNAYVTLYDGSSWDMGYPQIAPQVGTITTGAPLTGSGINTRSFEGKMTTTSYFSKLPGNGDTTLYKTRLWFSAYRTDYQHVWVYWNTFPEINQKYFIVQRRLSNETIFTNRDSIDSKAPNGVSMRNINYGITDPNKYSGTSFYRLLMISYTGDTTWSNIVAIGGTPDANGFTIWPNPAPGRFYVGISSIAKPKSIVVYDAIGQLMMTEAVNDRGFLEMRLRTPGTYMVCFISADGSVLETKRVVIVGN
ncbi:MAG: T9SS type A sorting domain-containing protein [Bacteroidetes bacterium]|nr:T9SS type A sorting domain-containing protein [Bacteroidota bacterium]